MAVVDEREAESLEGAPDYIKKAECRVNSLSSLVKVSGLPPFVRQFDAGQVRRITIRCSMRLCAHFIGSLHGSSLIAPFHPRKPRLRPALAEADVLQIGPDLEPCWLDGFDLPAIGERFFDLSP